MIRAALTLSIMVPFAAHAATADVTVRGADGRPLADAVVMIESAIKPAGPIHFPWPMVMAQQNIAFVPHILIVPVGATVAFPNKDRVRHHIYSFSKAKKFDIKLYGQDETRSETFDQPGVVAAAHNSTLHPNDASCACARSAPPDVHTRPMANHRAAIRCSEFMQSLVAKATTPR